jgi:hypothetical protein
MAINLDQLMLENILTYIQQNPNEKICVDIGCSDNSYCLILDDHKKIGFDADDNKLKNYNNSIHIVNKKITPENVLSVFKENNIPTNFSFLNLDIDGYDIFVLDKLLSEYSPYLICTEINEKIPPPIKFTVLYDEKYEWEVNHFFGYSLSCLEEILDKHGYDLVKLQYNNAFLIKKELNQFGSKSIEQAYKEGYIDGPSRKEIFYYNENVDCLIENNLSISDKLKFINNFFQKYKGKYELKV